MRQAANHHSPDQGRSNARAKGRPGRGSSRAGAGAPAGTRGGAGHATRKAGGQAAECDLYAQVTAQIVAELEAGRVPWVQPWSDAAGLAPGMPRNAVSGRPYSGINVLILWAAVTAHGWPTQQWLTFRQALDAGGHIRKGAHGTTIVFADRFVPRGAEAPETPVSGTSRGDPVNDDEPRAIPFLKRFTVFNVAQIDGLPARLSPEPKPLRPREIVDVGEQLIAASGAEVRVGGTEAYYAPALDIVQVPPQQAFFDQINYYRTCFHELAHATGHASRLGRDQTGAFGSPAYAREELIAELGAAFLCATLAIRPTVRHADYIGSWLKALRDDHRAIFRAAAAASRAADWLLTRLNAAQTAAATAAEAQP